jgi:hypothetical protein
MATTTSAPPSSSPPSNAHTTAHAANAGNEPVQPVAAVLAFALPGLGHWYLGYRARGVLIAIGVLGLFLGGVFIGGISCIDRKGNFIWFLGQSLNGPVAFVVDGIHQSKFKVVDRSTPMGLRSAHPNEFRNPSTGQPVMISIDANGKTSATYTDQSGATKTVSPAYPPYVESLGRVNELGTLFTTIAGFLNLICIIDALWHVPRREREGETLPTNIKAPTLTPPAIAGAGARAGVST